MSGASMHYLGEVRRMVKGGGAGGDLGVGSGLPGSNVERSRCDLVLQGWCGAGVECGVVFPKEKITNKCEGGRGWRFGWCHVGHAAND